MAFWTPPRDSGRKRAGASQSRRTLSPASSPPSEGRGVEQRRPQVGGEVSAVVVDPLARPCAPQPNSFLLTGDASGALRVYRTVDWRMIHRLSCGASPVLLISVHPSGRLAVVATADGRIAIVDLIRATVAIALPFKRQPIQIQWAPAPQDTPQTLDSAATAAPATHASTPATTGAAVAALGCVAAAVAAPPPSRQSPEGVAMKGAARGKREEEKGKPLSTGGPLLAILFPSHMMLVDASRATVSACVAVSAVPSLVRAAEEPENKSIGAFKRKIKSDLPLPAADGEAKEGSSKPPGPPGGRGVVPPSRFTTMCFPLANYFCIGDERGGIYGFSTDTSSIAAAPPLALGSSSCSLPPGGPQPFGCRLRHLLLGGVHATRVKGIVAALPGAAGPETAAEIKRPAAGAHGAAETRDGGMPAEAVGRLFEKTPTKPHTHKFPEFLTFKQFNGKQPFSSLNSSLNCSLNCSCIASQSRCLSCSSTPTSASPLDLVSESSSPSPPRSSLAPPFASATAVSPSIFYLVSGDSSGRLALWSLCVPAGGAGWPTAVVLATPVGWTDTGCRLTSLSAAPLVEQAGYLCSSPIPPKRAKPLKLKRQLQQRKSESPAPNHRLMNTRTSQEANRETTNPERKIGKKMNKKKLNISSSQAPRNQAAAKQKDTRASLRTNTKNTSSRDAATDGHTHTGKTIFATKTRKMTADERAQLGKPRSARGQLGKGLNGKAQAKQRINGTNKHAGSSSLEE
eukprot:GHVT01048572.1.p1 GENE.GHVT01048572.1~~GHVT01048572.1.p1  ORF type:complete len:741 (+),score=175.19 GHVT01048572.1:2875-5097(+)